MYVVLWFAAAVLVGGLIGRYWAVLVPPAVWIAVFEATEHSTPPEELGENRGAILTVLSVTGAFGAALGAWWRHRRG